MNTRSIAIVITFTALCIALIPLRIPTVYWPGFNYYFWGIPTVAAFLLFGFKISLSISVLNTLARMVILPLANPLIIPLISFQPLLTMLLGVCLGQKLILRRASKGKSTSDATKGLYLITLGVAVRATIMPFVDYVNYHAVLPLFFGTFAESYIIALMPGILLFNILVPLYEVSIGYLVAKTVNKSLKIGPVL
jgi:hypothetical protein